MAKITALTAIAAVAAEDLFAVVDAPSGTAVTTKATASQLRNYVLGIAGGIVNVVEAVAFASTLAVTGAITAAGGVAGNLTGNVNGDVTGNLTGNVTGNVTGNASTATALATGRTINGVSFNGTANVTVPAAAGTLTGATLASGVTASSLTSVGTLVNLTVTNPIAGSVTGSSGSTTGNAATATALANARTIFGVSFNGTANVTGALSGATTGAFSGNVTVGGVMRLAAGTAAAPAFSFTADSNSGLYQIGENIIGFATAGVEQARISTTGMTVKDLTMAGALTGATTGSFSGAVTAAAFVGNASTASQLQTARTINGVAFNGTANISVPTGVFANAAYLQWRNGANSADLNVMRVTAANSVEIEAPAGAGVQLRVNAVNIFAANAFGAALTGALTVSSTLGVTGLISGSSGFSNTQSALTGVFAGDASGTYIEAQGAANHLRLYGGASIRLISNTGGVSVGDFLAPVKLGILSGVATNNTSTPVLSFHSDRADVYATMNSHRGSDSTRLGLGFSTMDGGALVEWMRLYPNGTLQVNSLAGVGTRVVGVTSSGQLTTTSLGSGDVVGPASATNNAIATFNGTGGKTIKNNSGVTISSNVIDAAGYSIGGTAGDSDTIDTAAGTWAITVTGGLITSIVQTS